MALPYRMSEQQGSYARWEELHFNGATMMAVGCYFILERQRYKINVTKADKQGNN